MKAAAAALLLLFWAAPAAAAARRAVWMWEPDSYAALENRRAASEAIDFLKTKGISVVYLYADCFKNRCLITEKPRLYRRLIKRLNKEGIKTYALLGSWHLSTERYVLPEHRAEALTMLGRVLAYNAAAGPAERFAGVNLDIEPHLLEQWPARKEELLQGFLEMSAALMDLKRRSGLELAVGPALPFWFDGIALRWRGTLRPVSEHAQDLYDYVALMAYRDRAAGRDGIVSHSERELKYASAAGRKVAVGVETAPNEIEKVSFNRLTEADLERELSLAAAAFAEEPAFEGFVIHHYRAYRRWLEGQARRP